MARKIMKRKPVARAPLTRERVLQVAVDFADEHGIDALSMRELARELGFGVMSLYNHVANKDELLDGMVDRVASEIETPSSPGGDWRHALRETALSAHRTLLRHPWASAMWSTRTPGPARLRYFDSILRGLREAGFSVDTACRGFHAITTHVLGFTLQKLDFPVAQRDLSDVASDFLAEMSTADYPYFAEHVQHHIDAPHQGDSFEFVLDLILDGLERSER
jgi:AcrR family transcriptional regulator